MRLCEIFPDIFCPFIRWVISCNIFPFKRTAITIAFRIIDHHTFGSVWTGRTICRRIDSLAGAKDIFCNISIVFHFDATYSTAIRLCRHATNHNISAYRGNLTAAIDTDTNRGTALNGDISVATHQCRVTMRHLALSCTENAAGDIRCISSFRGSYYHLHIIFHAADLTPAIDVTLHHCGTAYSDIRCEYHGFLAPPCIVKALACSEHISMIGIGCAVRSYSAI